MMSKKKTRKSYGVGDNVKDINGKDAWNETVSCLLEYSYTEEDAGNNIENNTSLSNKRRRSMRSIGNTRLAFHDDSEPSVPKDSDINSDIGPSFHKNRRVSFIKEPFLSDISSRDNFSDDDSFGEELDKEMNEEDKENYVKESETTEKSDHLSLDNKYREVKDMNESVLGTIRDSLKQRVVDNEITIEDDQDETNQSLSEIDVKNAENDVSSIILSSEEDQWKEKHERNNEGTSYTEVNSFLQLSEKRLNVEVQNASSTIQKNRLSILVFTPSKVQTRIKWSNEVSVVEYQDVNETGTSSHFNKISESEIEEGECGNNTSVHESMIKLDDEKSGLHHVVFESFSMESGIESRLEVDEEEKHQRECDGKSNIGLSSAIKEDNLLTSTKNSKNMTGIWEDDIDYFTEEPTLDDYQAVLDFKKSISVHEEAGYDGGITDVESAISKKNSEWKLDLDNSVLVHKEAGDESESEDKEGYVDDLNQTMYGSPSVRSDSESRLIEDDNNVSIYPSPEEKYQHSHKRDRGFEDSSLIKETNFMKLPENTNNNRLSIIDFTPVKDRRRKFNDNESVIEINEDVCSVTLDEPMWKKSRLEEGIEALELTMNDYQETSYLDKSVLVHEGGNYNEESDIFKGESICEEILDLDKSVLIHERGGNFNEESDIFKEESVCEEILDLDKSVCVRGYVSDIEEAESVLFDNDAGSYDCNQSRNNLFDQEKGKEMESDEEEDEYSETPSFNIDVFPISVSFPAKEIRAHISVDSVSSTSANNSLAMDTSVDSMFLDKLSLLLKTDQTDTALKEFASPGDGNVAQDLSIDSEDRLSEVRENVEENENDARSESENSLDKVDLNKNAFFDDLSDEEMDERRDEAVVSPVSLQSLQCKVGHGNTTYATLDCSLRARSRYVPANETSTFNVNVLQAGNDILPIVIDNVHGSLNDARSESEKVGDESDPLDRNASFDHSLISLKPFTTPFTTVAVFVNKLPNRLEMLPKTISAPSGRSQKELPTFAAILAKGHSASMQIPDSDLESVCEEITRQCAGPLRPSMRVAHAATLSDSMKGLYLKHTGNSRLEMMAAYRDQMKERIDDVVASMEMIRTKSERLASKCFLCKARRACVHQSMTLRARQSVLDNFDRSWTTMVQNLKVTDEAICDSGSKMIRSEVQAHNRRVAARLKMSHSLAASGGGGGGGGPSVSHCQTAIVTVRQLNALTQKIADRGAPLISGQTRREQFYKYIIGRRLSPLFEEARGDRQTYYWLMGSRLCVRATVSDRDGARYIDSTEVVARKGLYPLNKILEDYYQRLADEHLIGRAANYANKLLLQWQMPVLLLMGDLDMCKKLPGLNMQWSNVRPFVVDVWIFDMDPLIRLRVTIDLNPVAKYQFRPFVYQIDDCMDNMNVDLVRTIIESCADGLNKLHRLFHELLTRLYEIYIVPDFDDDDDDDDEDDEDDDEDDNDGGEE